MIVFHADLDNTLIYSYKHEIGLDKCCAEIYREREISFFTNRTQKLLRQLVPYVQMVPTTTRTIQQYRRIELGIGTIQYALVCNGGQLLVNGKNDTDWYAGSKERIAESRDELEKAVRLLEAENSRIFEVRFIEELFVFTKCSRPKEACAYLKEHLNTNLIDVFQNGEKVYVLPQKLSKGNALVRFREYTGAEKIFAAGDSIFDRSMLEQADFAAAPADSSFLRPGSMPEYPQHLAAHSFMQPGIYRMSGRKIFSEEMLEFFLRIVLQ